jgi:hypothetical protein
LTGYYVYRDFEPDDNQSIEKLIVSSQTLKNRDD